jgi:hypothetical protein
MTSPLKGKQRRLAGDGQKHQRRQGRAQRDHGPQLEDEGRAGAVNRAFFKQLDQGVIVDQQRRSLFPAKKRFDLENPRINGARSKPESWKNSIASSLLQQPIKCLGLYKKQQHHDGQPGYSRYTGGYRHAAASAACQTATAPVERPAAHVHFGNVTDMAMIVGFCGKRPFMGGWSSSAAPPA